MHFALWCSFLPEKWNFHEMFLKKKIDQKTVLFGKKLCQRAKCKKADPTWNSILLPVQHHPTHWGIFESLAMEWFDCGLSFTHFYLITSNLLPNFLVAVTHLIFNNTSSVIKLMLVNCRKKLISSPKKMFLWLSEVRCLQLHRISWWACIYKSASFFKWATSGVTIVTSDAS